MRWNEPEAEQSTDRPSPEPAENGGDADGKRQAGGDFGPVAVGLSKELKGEYGQQDPDRVIDDALPFQQRGGALVEACLLQKGSDDCRSGDHQNGTEHDRDRPAQPGYIVPGQGPQGQSNR